MEESDNMLISTLKEHIDIPNHIIALSDIRAEELLVISIKILEYLKADTAQIKSLSAKQQKFRSMAKLNQCLQGTLQANFQLNELMNPSIPFLRKFMLVVVNKIGYGESADKSKAFSLQSRTIQNATRQKINLKQWLTSEWIHPSLAAKKPKYKGYILPLTINKNMLKNNVNITQQLNNPLLQGNGQSALNMTQAKFNQMVRQFQANQGISRKEYEQAQIRIQNIIKNNKDDWFINYNKLNKIKKKIIEEKEQPSSEIQLPLVTSVFKQELEQAQLEAESKKQLQDIKPKEKNEVDSLGEQLNLNPLELLRKQAENKKNQYEEQIRQIVNQLQSRKQAIESWQKEKELIHEKMYADEQKMTKLKQQTVELKKHVQKRQNILATLEGEKNIEEQVSKLEEEIKMIETQAKQEVDSIQTEIKEMQLQSKQKMEALNDLKTKLSKIETDYSKICEEITEKEEIKGKVKIMKSSISRLYYHRKISDMESRWRDQQKEIKKLKASLVELRQKTRISSTLSQRVETEIDNIINNEKAKKEQETKPLRQLINKCKEYYHATLKTLEEVNEVKLQTQDYEVKVHALSGKNFKQSIQKINMAMQDLKREMAELNKSKAK